MSRKSKTLLVVSLIGNLLIFYVAVKALEYRSHINHFLEKYTQVVAEFSGRTVYEQANNNVPEPDSTRPRVVFIGSQLTTGWDLSNYFPDIDAINRGVDSQRVAGFPLRFYPDVIRLQPSVVVIEMSSYNFRSEETIPELQDYLMTMVDISGAHRIHPILTTVLPPRSDLQYNAYHVVDSVRKFNAWLRNWSDENDLQYIDMAQLLSGEDGLLLKELSTDHITLNEQGYTRLSASIDSVFDEMFVMK